MLTVTTISNQVCDTLEDPSLEIALEGLVTDEHICADAMKAGVCVGDFGGPCVVEGSDVDGEECLGGSDS
jgi:secreted trypsin-like serine protease